MSRSQAERSFSTWRRCAANMDASLNMASLRALEVALKAFSSDRPHFCFTCGAVKGRTGQPNRAERSPSGLGSCSAGSAGDTHRLCHDTPSVGPHGSRLLRGPLAWPQQRRAISGQPHRGGALLYVLINPCNCLRLPGTWLCEDPACCGRRAGASTGPPLRSRSSVALSSCWRGACPPSHAPGGAQTANVR